ncbi:MAG TPA: PilZ domain-containing protein [Kofleriaceae bacterium]|nr:PilZ domain-containing protein [Kofleriaceae bacterium]
MTSPSLRRPPRLPVSERVDVGLRAAHARLVPATITTVSSAGLGIRLDGGSLEVDAGDAIRVRFPTDRGGGELPATIAWISSRRPQTFGVELYLRGSLAGKRLYEEWLVARLSRRRAAGRMRR